MIESHLWLKRGMTEVFCVLEAAEITYLGGLEYVMASLHVHRSLYTGEDSIVLFYDDALVVNRLLYEAPIFPSFSSLVEKGFDREERGH